MPGTHKKKTLGSLLRQSYSSIRDWVKEHPYISIAIAAGVITMIGLTAGFGLIPLGFAGGAGFLTGMGFMTGIIGGGMVVGAFAAAVLPLRHSDDRKFAGYYLGAFAGLGLALASAFAVPIMFPVVTFLGLSILTAGLVAGLAACIKLAFSASKSAHKSTEKQIEGTHHGVRRKLSHAHGAEFNKKANHEMTQAAQHQAKSKKSHASSALKKSFFNAKEKVKSLMSLSSSHTKKKNISPSKRR